MLRPLTVRQSRCRRPTLSTGVQTTAEMIQQLAQDSQKINIVVSVIHSIAEQTNLLELIERCFPQKTAGEWATKLQEIFPAREKVLETDAELYRKINTQNNISLELVAPAAETESYA